MRSLSTLICFILVALSHARTGQVADRITALTTRGVRFAPIQLLTTRTDASAGLWSEALLKADVLSFDAGNAVDLQRSQAEHISMRLPFEGGALVLDLARVDVWEDRAKVVLASGSEGGRLSGVHYRGMVRGVAGSWAAISVFNDEVMGLVNDGNGQIVVGRLDKSADGLHVIYRDSDLRRTPSFSCGTEERGGAYERDQLELRGGERTVRCVRYYWEVNHNVFLDKGNVVNTTNYVTGLFNQSALLFDNDGIDITLSELFIWDVASPYTGPGSGDFLDQFGDTRTSFNGDMAHLIGYGGGGGVAWLNTLCNSTTWLRMAYSGINSTYANVPTYSWSTMVVTHEAGHNLGSRHTHACAWNGNGTNIDGCGPTANINYSEGSCAIGPIPAAGVGGTIMSYCHLIGGVGINLSNGFGPQPTAVIVNAVNAASCLGVCGTTCDAPGNLAASSITVNSAILSWSAIGVTNYELQWRPVGSPTWNTVTGLTGNTYALSGLTQGTNYEFQVRSVCSGTPSAYSAVRTFTTPVPCPEALEPNNSLATAATITLPTTVSALIAANGDLDHYTFTTTGINNITMTLSGMPADYDLRLLSSTGTILAASELGGTSSEFISYTNAPAGVYYAFVFGYNGAFSTTVCYSLFVRANPPECLPPQGVTATSITYNSASVSWPTVGTASAYDLRWKETSASTWTDVNGIAAPPHVLNGLAPLTSYDVQVRAVCAGGVQGGSSSAYSTTVSFVTAAAPCEVAPPIRVAVRVLLDGAYNATGQLMSDSLRADGLIPLQEPYTAMGHALQGAAATTEAVLSASGSDAIVDWVVLELRGATAPFAIVEARAALLQRDGDVVGVDGTSAVFFCAPGGQPYNLGVRHRNHFAVVSTQAMNLGPTTTAVDFAAGYPSYGTQAQRFRDGVYLLWAGNAVNDGLILYTGDANDRDAILLAIGGAVPTNSVAGYRQEDVNLDGLVKYSGSNNDRDVILNTIGGAIPTNSVVQQMP